ncbi:hypothetical protein L9F63_023620, partial [Diploptera punctata]
IVHQIPCRTQSTKRAVVLLTCNSLQELKRKGKVKLGIEENVRVQMTDGTIVDDEDYFQTIPSQTLFLLLKPDEDAVTGTILLYNALKAVNIDYLKAGNAAETFFSNNLKEKLNLLSKLLKKESKKWNTKASTKDDDPKWFEGIDSRSKTKEEFMTRRSQDRIRGYLYKTQDDLKKSPSYNTDSMFRTKLTDAMNAIVKQLKCDSYFGGYFDRSNKSVRLCDELGNFECKGQWNLNECRYKKAAISNHVINPYESREARIVFSTWNFDHVIERSRTIIPAILEAAKMASASENKSAINYNYFYKLIFTTANLKLVHIVCHDKSVHNVKCDAIKYSLRCLELDGRSRIE